MQTGDDAMPVHGHFVRAGLAHAELLSIDLDAARAASGVLLAMDAKALAELGFSAQPPGPRQPPLARGVLRYLGEPVALIVAETESQAKAAADLVELTLIERPEQRHLLPGAAALHPEVPGNLAFDHRIGPAELVSDALEIADHRLTMTQTHLPLRAAPDALNSIFEWNNNALRIDLHNSLQGADPAVLAAALHLAPSAIVVNNPLHRWDATRLLPEHLCLAFAARKLSRRICWRGEGAISDQSPDLLIQTEIGFDADFRIIVLRVNLACNLGAYAEGNGLAVVEHFATAMTGDYDIGLASLGALGVLTNAAPRPAVLGRSAAVMMLERALDTAARQLRIDPVALRLRNLRQDLTTPPAATPLPGVGRGHACLPAAVTGATAEISLQDDGVAKVQLSSRDPAPQLADLLSQATGIPPDMIRLLPGPAQPEPDLQAEAVRRATSALIDGLRLFLQQDLNMREVTFQDHDFSASGSNMRLNLAEAADWAREKSRFDLLQVRASAGEAGQARLHLAEVALDPATGALELTRYWPESGALLAGAVLRHLSGSDGAEVAVLADPSRADDILAAAAALANAVQDALAQLGVAQSDPAYGPQDLLALLQEAGSVPV